MLVNISAENSDNKLTQKEWYEFVRDLDYEVTRYESHRHFFGGSHTWAPWQNVCWTIEIYEQYLKEFKSMLTSIRKDYRQDSVCILVGQAEFI